MASSRRGRKTKLTSRAAMLLRGEETLTAEFKRSPAAVEPDDFVQFANAPHGGDILVGVEEVTDEAGRRMPRVIGCPVNDPTKRGLLDKALSCSPPIGVEIIVEQNDGIRFYRVHVPTGPHKPYCTTKGVYKIRSDGRAAPLLPEDLLQLFVEAEGATFLRRFQEATQQLDAQMANLSDRLDELFTGTEDQLTRIFHTAENADSLADEAMNHSAEAAAGVEHLGTEVQEVREEVQGTARRLAAILQHLGVADPVEAEARALMERLLGSYDWSSPPRPTPAEPVPPTPGRRSRGRADGSANPGGHRG